MRRGEARESLGIKACTSVVTLRPSLLRPFARILDDDGPENGARNCGVECENWDFSLTAILRQGPRMFAGLRPWMLFLAACVLLAGCRSSRPKDADELACEELTSEWLAARGEKEIVRDDRGVGVARSPVRVQGRLRVATQRAKAVVEMEFRVRLAEGAEIVELAGGQGPTTEAARREAFQGFAATVLGPVRDAFFPGAGSTSPERVGASARELFIGAPVVLGVDSSAIVLTTLRSELPAALGSVPFPAGRPSWCKIVHTQRDQQAIGTEVLLNNQPHPQLSETLSRLDWPKRKEGYLAKLFVVVK